jgi:hypothetical protein
MKGHGGICSRLQTKLTDNYFFCSTEVVIGDGKNTPF